MSGFIGKVKRYGLIYLGCLIGFSIVLICANAIPVSQRMERNLSDSAALLQEEGEYPALIKGAAGWTLDNCTTALMLNIAGHGCDLGVRGAFANYHYDDGSNALQSVMLARSLGKSPVNGGDAWVSYARYWHGYLFILKPLLLIWNVSEIRVIFYFVISILIVSNALLIAWLRRAASGVAFAFSFFACAYPAASFSLSLAFSFIISLLANLVVIRAARPGRHLDVMQMCYIVGAITVYCDFLCTPLITLGIPLGTYIYLRASSTEKVNARKTLGIVLGSCIAWVCSYAMLWASKWVLSTIVLQQNVIADAMSQLFLRTDLDAGRFNAVNVNYAVLRPVWIVVICIGCFFLVRALLFQRELLKQKGVSFLILTLIALLPFCWYCILSNHSTVHYWFTWRAQIVSLLCLLYICLLLQPDNKASITSCSMKEELLNYMPRRRGSHFAAFSLSEDRALPGVV